MDRTCCNSYSSTFAGLGPMGQQIKASEGNSQAGGLNSWSWRGPFPQLAAQLGDATQGGAVLVLDPHQGHQERHQGAEEDAQQRAPSPEDAAAGVTPQRRSSHDDSGVNAPSFGGTSPHVCIHPNRSRRRASPRRKHTIMMDTNTADKHTSVTRHFPPKNTRLSDL